MIRTLLFDLDGTLLHVDMDYFLQHYFKALTKALAPYIPPKVFMKKLWESTEAMIRDTNPEKTNKDVFTENFFNTPKYGEEELFPVFDKFYREEYGKLHKYTKKKPEALNLLQKARELGFELVIATNPVFPRAAVDHRLTWAGVNSLEYSLVTTYENMHFCKPNLNYYQEILEKIGRRPEECIMVGNDAEDDMVAGRLGMGTYLIDDFLVNHKGNIQVDWQGSLAALEKELSKLRD